MEIMGIDIGGSGIKGALVDIDKGTLTTDRFRVPTPQPSKPKAVAKAVAEIIEHFEWNGPIGCTFPAIIKKGVAYSAANVDDEWIGTDAARLIQRYTGDPVLIINDADAAGIAEMHFGAGRGHKGVVIMLTLGTGIGSAVFVNGELLPNTELGHLELRGMDGEDRASDRIRTEKDLGWKKWAKRLNEYIGHVEFLFSPDLFIIGGGISRKYQKYFPYLELQTEIVPAQLRNEAGIVGAAMAAKSLV
ncbi:MAG: ROK family protein [Anaerolineae bacterium]|nr:ROK family protein [Anaerolineae bacterium]MCA9890009.1 ROK family protein [Anaerolineae bacterium]MCA9892423.1 ROK family protein [Anaerolineae bacterium]MCB9459878.1 ROK family protein [Anaerolineaceae bacterium]